MAGAVLELVGRHCRRHREMGRQPRWRRQAEGGQPDPGGTGALGRFGMDVEATRSSSSSRRSSTASPPMGRWQRAGRRTGLRPPRHMAPLVFDAQGHDGSHGNGRPRGVAFEDPAGAEINATGKVVYGYNLRVTGGGSSTDQVHRAQCQLQQWLRHGYLCAAPRRRCRSRSSWRWRWRLARRRKPPSRNEPPAVGFEPADCPPVGRSLRPAGRVSGRSSMLFVFGQQVWGQS